MRSGLAAAVRRERPALRAHAAAAPRLGCARIARALGGELDWLWRGRDGELVAGAGRIAEIAATGPGRFAAVREAARELFARAAVPGLRLYGGFAFAPGGAGAAEWRGFGDARFAVPRLCYRAADGGAVLEARYDEAEDRGGRRARAALEATLARLEDSAGVAAGRARRGRSEARRGRDGYIDLVARARQAICEGAMAKVVVARRVRVATGGVDLAALLGELETAYPGCYLLLRRGTAGVLVAASPERLIAARGRRIDSEALAGTAPAARASALLSSAKLQHEHRLTSEHIATALADAGCTELEVAAPRIRRLPGLAHLETPIRGRRSAGAHILDLAAALHPTPAVAGLPAKAACRFIAEDEGIDRGWYAGPVGWFDGSGDGELAVALRAGVLSGTGAWLYAGAGIVAASDPAAEWEETELKLEALRAHLEEAIP